MYLTATPGNTMLFDAEAIRSTDATDSATIDVFNYPGKTIYIKNGLDKNISVQVVAVEGSDTVNLGSAQIVNVGDKTLIGTTEVASLAYKFRQLKLSVTAADVPTTGTLSANAYLSGV